LVFTLEKSYDGQNNAPLMVVVNWAAEINQEAIGE
jgi:hypothetical protein